MGAFELENGCCCEGKKKEDCIIALKVYDQCKFQKCLTPDLLGPARAAESTVCQCEQICEGDIIVPPANATSVDISNFKLQKIRITSKKPNPFRCGYWDIEVKYIFSYTLTFCTDCMTNFCIKAKSSYTTKLTLFGSTESDIVLSSDFGCIDTTNVNGGPFVSVEAKAIPLRADFCYETCNPCDCGCTCCDCGCGTSNPCGCNIPSSCGCGTPNPCGCEPSCGCGVPVSCGCEASCGCNSSSSGAGAASVSVTIGLFSIIKLFRPVTLHVASSGICVPEECTCDGPTANPCDYFNNLSFPINLFCPPDNDSGKEGCGCGCK